MLRWRVERYLLIERRVGYHVTALVPEHHVYSRGRGRVKTSLAESKSYMICYHIRTCSCKNTLPASTRVSSLVCCALQLLANERGMLVLGWVLCSELLSVRSGPQQRYMRPPDELSTFARAPQKGCGAFSSCRNRLPRLQSRRVACTMASAHHNMPGTDRAPSYSRPFLPDVCGRARGYQGEDRWVVSTREKLQNILEC